MTSPSRLWRIAAQRSLRNSWSSISAAHSSWSSASARGLAAATELVNALLTHRYMGSMDLGVLSSVKDIRSHAKRKLRQQQIAKLDDLVAAYLELEEATCKLVNEVKSMRVFVKSSGSLVSYSSTKVYEDDTGDGDGVPVFTTLTMNAYEDLGEEIAEMHVRELRIKWLIVSELKSAVGAHSQELSAEKLEVLESALSCQPGNSFHFSKHELTRETMEVYLSSWLAETKLRKSRVDEIVALVAEEMRS